MARSDNPDEDEWDLQAELAAWKARALKLQLLEPQLLAKPGSQQPQQGPTRQPGAFGVSLAFLSALSDLLDDCEWIPEDVQGIVDLLIAPLTGKKGCMLDMVPSKHLGPPQFYVVYARGADFRELVSQLLSSLGGGGPKSALQRIFVWLDIMTLPQGKAGMEPSLDVVRDTIASCTDGMVVVVDPELKVMKRTWCNFEMWVGVHYCNLSLLRVALPEAISLAQMEAFESACERLDMTLTESSRPDDKQQIMQIVRRTVGVKLMAKDVTQTLLRSSRVMMSFNPDVHQRALYCAVLVKSGEYRRCLQVLVRMEELHDDTIMLQEMRQLFHLYDKEGTGELDKTDFLAVLKATGYEQEEAEKAFLEVNTDGTGGVSLEEWQDMWIRSNRQQMKSTRKLTGMYGNALEDRLKMMVELTRREGLEELELFFSEFLAKMQRSPPMFKPKQELAATPMRGEWLHISAQCVWKVHVKNHRAAVKPLYDLLMDNSDQLDYDLRVLPNPKSICGEGYLKHLLKLYLVLLSTIVCHQPGQRSYAEYLQHCAQEVVRPAKYRNILNSDGTISEAKFEAKKFEIVRNMVYLKYGDGHPITQPLIIEAELALGQWLSAHKLECYDPRRRKVDQLAGEQRLDLQRVALSYVKGNATGGIDTRQAAQRAARDAESASCMLQSLAALLEKGDDGQEPAAPPEAPPARQQPANLATFTFILSASVQETLEVLSAMENGTIVADGTNLDMFGSVVPSAAATKRTTEDSGDAMLHSNIGSLLNEDSAASVPGAKRSHRPPMHSQSTPCLAGTFGGTSEQGPAEPAGLQAVARLGSPAARLVVERNFLRVSAPVLPSESAHDDATLVQRTPSRVQLPALEPNAAPQRQHTWPTPTQPEQVPGLTARVEQSSVVKSLFSMVMGGGPGRAVQAGGRRTLRSLESLLNDRSDDGGSTASSRQRRVVSDETFGSAPGNGRPRRLAQLPGAARGSRNGGASVSCDDLTPLPKLDRDRGDGRRAQGMPTALSEPIALGGTPSGGALLAASLSQGSPNAVAAVGGVSTARRRDIADIAPPPSNPTPRRRHDSPSTSMSGAYTAALDSDSVSDGPSKPQGLALRPDAPSVASPRRHKGGLNLLDGKGNVSKLGAPHRASTYYKPSGSMAVDAPSKQLPSLVKSMAT